MKTIKYLSILIIAAIFASCSKGEQGPAGPAGSNGVANINSYTYTIYTYNWAVGSNNWEYVDLNESNITNSNTDGVIVGVSEFGNGDWFGVPCSSFAVVGDVMLCDYDNGVVRIQYSSNGSSGGSAPSITLYFKVTVIPPAIQHKYPNVNWKNYSQVAALPEFQAALEK